MIRKTLLLSALFLLPVSLLFATDDHNGSFSEPAQTLLQSANTAQSENAAQVVTILSERSYDIDAKSRVITRIHRILRMETAEAAENWASISVTYAPWHQEKPEINIRVVTPDGAEHLLDPKVLTDAPATDDEDEAVYNDNRVLQGPLPSVVKGAVIEEEFILRDREPLFEPGVGRQIYVGTTAGPTERTSVTVRVPKSAQFRYTSKLLPNVSVEKKEDTEFVVYKFEQGRMAMLEKAEENLPGDVPESPYIAFSTGSSWAALSTAYNAIVEAKIRTADVQELVSKEVKSGDSREDKIAKLYRLLHRRVRYTGVEFGDAALVPALPAESLKRGYGDCKDKAVLLASMLRAAGIPAQLALLTVGPGEDTDPELPSLDFNHAIVYVPGPPALWIDATASKYQVGPMPPGDAGRLALVIGDKVNNLVRIPENQPEDNITIEKRDLALAEYGPARIMETSLPKGIAEANYRNWYASTDSKESRESFEKYVKWAYLSEKMGKVQHSDASDMSKPFNLSIEVEKGRRGYTDMEDAVAVIVQTGLIDNLPNYLKANDDELTEKEKQERAKKPRTADFVFTPFITEWQYRIVPPLGFKVRAVPESKTENLGPATLSYQYSTDKDGALLADLRFNTVRGRYTAQEAEAMRTAVREFRKRDYIVLSFDNIGHALVASGKVAEGLKQYQAIAAVHPKEALHRTQYANALFDVGLCETARTEATKATELDTKSWRAFLSLGWILEHDLVCRRFKKGFDFDGAVAAYKKAAELDPDETGAKLNLAILYEHGKDGYQYSTSAQLNDAIAIWQEVRKTDKDKFQRFRDNLLFDLMYAQRWKELQDELTNVSMDATHRGMVLVATVGLSGSAAALEQSYRITSDEGSRSGALITAGNYLIRLRRYADVAEMLSAGAKGQADSAAALQRADLFRHTKRYEETILPDTDPRSVVQKVIVLGMKNPDSNELFDLIFPQSLQGMSHEKFVEKMKNDRQGGSARATAEKSGIPVDMLIDVALSNMQLAVEGNDEVGYRVTTQAIGAKNEAFYIVKADGKYKMLGSSHDEEDIGAEVLSRLKKNDLAGARKLLDWARSDISISAGDDPLAGDKFPRLWTRGQEATAEQMHLAAASTLSKREDVHQFIPEILKARDEAKTPQERSYIDTVLATAYQKDHNWKESKAFSLQLATQYPTSDVARRMLAFACDRLKDWTDIEKAIRARLAVVPDDDEAQRELADMYAAEMKFDDSVEVLKKLIERGRAKPDDLNSYAWNQLLAGHITDDGVEQVRRGVSQNKNYAIVHTLASLYAERGNEQEARQLVLDIMSDYGMDEPDDSLWYVFGRVAEAYGQPEAAAACYKRLKWEEKFDPDPRTTYVLAQKRLASLEHGQAAGAK